MEFYNNSSCSVNDAFGSSVTNIAGTESSNARILSGLPASPYAATGTYDGAQLRALAALLREFASYPQLGGVMLWSAGFSSININHSCNHARDRVCTHLTSGLPSDKAASWNDVCEFGLGHNYNGTLSSYTVFHESSTASNLTKYPNFHLSSKLKQ